MASYSKEFKEQIIKKMMPPNNQSVAQIAKETGLPYATLYTWKQNQQSKGFVVPAKKTTTDQWDSKAKLAVIIQTAAMNEAERAEYCRENGLYVEQINEWKAGFEASSEAVSSAEKRNLATERKKVKMLEKELLRKDRALAETAALLALSKKAQAIWDISEED